MSNREELLRAAREKRETAARIKRLAQGLSLNDDHKRLMGQAREVESEAAELERQAEGNPATPPPLPRGMPMQTQQQVQQQQQQEADPKPPDNKDSGKP
jgi:hypothetical protein